MQIWLSGIKNLSAHAIAFSRYTEEPSGRQDILLGFRRLWETHSENQSNVRILQENQEPSDSQQV
jgi:hypothetical protein